MKKPACLKTLRRAQENGIMVALYSDRDAPHRFAAGFVHAISAEHLCLRHVSTNGRYDGYVVRLLEDVFRVDVHSRYVEAIAFLYQAREQSHTSDFLGAPEENDNLFFEVLRAAHDHELAVTVCLDDDGEEEISGFVRELDYENVTLNIYDANGQADGEAVFTIEDITRLNCDDEDLQDIRLLSRWHQMEPPW